MIKKGFQYALVALRNGDKYLAKDVHVEGPVISFVDRDGDAHLVSGRFHVLELSSAVFKYRLEHDRACQ